MQPTPEAALTQATEMTMAQANSHSISRRNALKAAVAVTAAAVPAVAVAADDDHELRRLWAEYCAHAADRKAACAAMRPVRDAFDAEMVERQGESWRWDESKDTWKQLWAEYGLGPLYDAWEDACGRAHEMIPRILATRARTPFGLAVKLAALPLDHVHEEDFEEAVRSVMVDIDGMLGGNEFSTAFEQL